MSDLGGAMTACDVCGRPSAGTRCPDHPGSGGEVSARADGVVEAAEHRDDDQVVTEADKVRQAEHESEVREILVAADERDKQADFRDANADRRDEAAALDVMVYGTDAERPFLGRRQAAKDRKQSQHDRSAGHIDRFLLTGVEVGDDTDEEGETGADTDAADTQPGEADSES
jgi:hypothetical protein